MYLIRKYPPKNLVLKKNYKIALVGFYPITYPSNISENRPRGSKRIETFVLDYNSTIKNLLPFGKPIQEIPTNGIDQSVSSEAAEDFFFTYIDSVNRSGLFEISHIISYEQEGDSLKFSLKKRDVDFYVVAVLGPESQGFWSAWPRLFISMYPAILTLGTIPGWTSQKVVSSFYLYDKHLNLLDSKTFDNRYEILSTWWAKDPPHLMIGLPQRNLSKRYYEPDVKEYSDHVIDFLNKHSE